MTALNDLVDDMAALFDAPCTLEDPEFRLIGFSDQRQADRLDHVRRRSILERGSSQEVRDWFQAHGIREAVQPVRTPADPAQDIAARLCVPARHLGRVHGYFWLLDGDHRIGEELWPEAMRIAESAASLLSLVETRQARRDAYYRAVVEGHPGEARHAATELAAAAGLDIHEPVTCVLVQRPDLVEHLASRPTRAGVVWAREDTEVSAAVVRAEIVKSREDSSGVLTALGLGRRLPVLDAATHVGVGPVVAGLDELMHARTGARVALRVSKEHQGGAVVRWDGLGPLALLGVARDDDLARVVMTPSIRKFLHEAPNELVATARVFLIEAGSVSRTAAHFRVHRQTVYHRLENIQRLSGCDLQQGEARLRLHLALTLAPYLSHVDSRLGRA